MPLPIVGPRGLGLLAVSLLATSSLAAQRVTSQRVTAKGATRAAPTWRVRPEWIRAHESFLASDAMRGRGSATHDEEVAATYVASQFMAYGLAPAPGMTTYVQRVALSAPQLTGTATLTAGGVTLHEGRDFDLLMTSSDPIRAPLRKESAQVGATTSLGGAIAVVGSSSGDALAAASALLRRGAAAVVLPESGSSDTLAMQMGGKTRVSVRLADAPSQGGGPTIVVVHRDAFAQLASVANGSPAVLDVQTVATAAPRATYNAVAYLAGTDPSSGTILLSAHLDHLGVGRAIAGDSIYNGADDDAAGTTAVLELAHALAAGPRPRRSILFVCYGSEEIGELGSTYFGEHPPVPLASLVANLEFEMIGVQDPKMPKGVLLLTGWDRSNLGPTLRAHGAQLGPDPYPEQHFFERSDNYALALRGVVAHTAAGWGVPPTYHQLNDDLSHIDVGFMTSAIQSLIEPVRWLATSDFRPAWNPGGQPRRESR